MKSANRQKDKSRKAKTQVVKGIILQGKFLRLYKQDDKFAYFIKSRNKQHRLPISLEQLAKLEIVERRVAV